MGCICSPTHSLPHNQQIIHTWKCWTPLHLESPLIAETNAWTSGRKQCSTVIWKSNGISGDWAEPFGCQGRIQTLEASCFPHTVKKSSTRVSKTQQYQRTPALNLTFSTNDASSGFPLCSNTLHCWNYWIEGVYRYIFLKGRGELSTLFFVKNKIRGR